MHENREIQEDEKNLSLFAKLDQVLFLVMLRVFLPTVSCSRVSISWLQSSRFYSSLFVFPPLFSLFIQCKSVNIKIRLT